MPCNECVCDCVKFEVKCELGLHMKLYIAIHTRFIVGPNATAAERVCMDCGDHVSHPFCQLPLGSCSHLSWHPLDMLYNVVYVCFSPASSTARTIYLRV